MASGGYCNALLSPQEGDTPLHDAVRHNRLKIIELLLQHAADTSLTNQVRLTWAGLGWAGQGWAGLGHWWAAAVTPIICTESAVVRQRRAEISKMLS